MITVALSYKWSIFAELIFHIEIAAMGIMIVFINKSDFIEEKTNERHVYSATMSMMVTSYFLLGMFI